MPCRIPTELSDTAFFTERALTYLKGVGGKPWFLHLGYYRPHPPFIAPAPYNAHVPPGRRCRRRCAPPTPREEARQHPLLDFYLRAHGAAALLPGRRGPAAGLDEAAVRQMRATYAGLMTEIDDSLGRVFAYLDETGQWDDTLVVFTSDHGEQLGDH